MQKTQVGGPEGIRARKGTTPDDPRAGTVLGRYVVLSQLGAGGMGVVFGAFDPELDRKVAIKLVSRQQSLSEASRLRLQHEAQALARLSHPNVVSVYDVGLYNHQVFVAMEFVEGSTLAAWLQHRGGPPRAWQEILHCLQAAGRGLCAAHEHGLIHRDFKPENVMVGKDGRVRVMDFGLVREHGAREEELPRLELDGLATRKPDVLGSYCKQTTGAVGTLGYMSPEQLMNAELTPKSDQFSFFVTLYEALYGHNPFRGETVLTHTTSVLDGVVREPSGSARVPRWLHRIVLQGLAREPHDRFESMTQALEALDSGEIRRRRTRALLAVMGVGLVIACLFGYRHWELASRHSNCLAQGDAVTEVWNDQARQVMSESLLATEVSFAESAVENVTYWLDERTEEWQQQRTEICLNVSVRETWDRTKFEKAAWCLEDRRLSMAALVNVLSDADQLDAQMAVQSAAKLEPASHCTNDSVLAGMPDPPERALRPRITKLRAEISRAMILHKAGKFSESLSLLGDARGAADPIGWKPVLALVLASEAAVLMSLGKHAESEATAMDGYTIAVRSNAWLTAATSAIELAFVVGYMQGRPKEGMLWATHAETAIHHAGDPAGLWEASRLTSVSAIHAGRRDYTKAIELSTISLATLKEQMGPQHPNTALALNNLGALHRLSGDGSEALRFAEQALLIWEQTLGAKHPVVAAPLGTLAEVYLATDRELKAISVLERKWKIEEDVFGRADSRVAATAARIGDAHHARQDFKAARRFFELSLELYSQDARVERANLHRKLGELQLSSGEFPSATRHFERALTLRAESDSGQAAAIRFSLARALWGAADPSVDVQRRALSEARRALEESSDAEDAPPELGEKIEAWLLKRGGTTTAPDATLVHGASG
ncbi:MAG: protein kinase domain-containing protein [Nannocystaceae bacterium]